MYVSLDQVRTRSLEQELFDLILEWSKNCVVDNTNIRREDRGRYIPAAQARGCRVVGYYFEPDLNGCLARNGKRSEKARVPDRAIRGKLAVLEPPTRAEGFDEIFRVRLTEEGFQVEEYHETEQQGRKWSELQELFWKKGRNWNNLATAEKRGVCVYRHEVVRESPNGPVTRMKFFIDREIPVFTSPDADGWFKTVIGK